MRSTTAFVVAAGLALTASAFAAPVEIGANPTKAAKHLDFFSGTVDCTAATNTTGMFTISIANPEIYDSLDIPGTAPEAVATLGYLAYPKGSLSGSVELAGLTSGIEFQFASFRTSTPAAADFVGRTDVSVVVVHVAEFHSGGSVTVPAASAVPAPGAAALMSLAGLLSARRRRTR